MSVRSIKNEMFWRRECLMFSSYARETFKAQCLDFQQLFLNLAILLYSAIENGGTE